MQRQERGFWSRANPINAIRERVESFMAHPVQNTVSGVLGIAHPALGVGSRQAFRSYNNRQFDNSAQRNNARVGEMGDAAAQNAMSRSPWDAPTGDNSRADLINALMGGQRGPQQPSMGTYGGQQALNSGGYNVQNQWAQQQPQSILGGMPQSPMPQLDLSGLDAALAARGGGRGQGGRGGNPGAGWSGVMGPGANGHALIRGTQMFGAGGAGGSSKFYNRDQGSAAAQ